MTSVTLLKSVQNAKPLWLLGEDEFKDLIETFAPRDKNWALAHGFTAKPGSFHPFPDEEGGLGFAVFGLPKTDTALDQLSLGSLIDQLPEGAYSFCGQADNMQLASLACTLKAYQFTKYKEGTGKSLDLGVPDDVEIEEINVIRDGIFLARDLINTPANDMGPEELELAIHTLADHHGATFSVIYGDELIDQNFPLIHAVGRASTRAPRLVRFDWGQDGAPHICLVGKGVCFDTGGLDLKPSSAMTLMKKDMGGAANILGLAAMIMAAQLNIRLTVLIPAVENSVSGNAFRPGDVLPSRKGLSVEIGNTDAEGRLVLADALALADEHEPEMIIDMATLTGAARVAIGADIAPFYASDKEFASALIEAADQVGDPVWQFPLWAPYEKMIASKIADVNHISPGPFAGSITAALFLQKFVEKCQNWSHFDVYGWTQKPTSIGPEGGETHAIRALFETLKQKYS